MGNLPPTPAYRVQSIMPEMVSVLFFITLEYYINWDIYTIKHVYKGHLREWYFNMWPLWAVALYIQLKFFLKVWHFIRNCRTFIYDAESSMDIRKSLLLLVVNSNDERNCNIKQIYIWASFHRHLINYLFCIWAFFCLYIYRFWYEMVSVLFFITLEYKKNKQIRQ
jgi:hypothetical protein